MTEPNLPLLRKVWDKINEIPSAEEAMGEKTASLGDNPVLYMAQLRCLDDEEVWAQGTWGSPTRCGTAACFAGWACELSDVEAEPSDNTGRRATELLGLTRDEARSLFYALNSKENIREALERVFERGGERFE